MKSLLSVLSFFVVVVSLVHAYETQYSKPILKMDDPTCFLAIQKKCYGWYAYSFFLLVLVERTVFAHIECLISSNVWVFHWFVFPKIRFRFCRYKDLNLVSINSASGIVTHLANLVRKNFDFLHPFSASLQMNKNKNSSSFQKSEPLQSWTEFQRYLLSIQLMECIMLSFQTHSIWTTTSSVTKSLTTPSPNCYCPTSSTPTTSPLSSSTPHLKCCLQPLKTG